MKVRPTWVRRLALSALALVAAGSHAAEQVPQNRPSDDRIWLREQGTLCFHDAFDRDEIGHGALGIGNGWESATADRVPSIKQADIDAGILKVASATKQAGHAAHIHHDAGFRDGGAIVRFRFPGQSTSEVLQLGYVDRSLTNVHAGHLCYGILTSNRVTLIDHKTGVMNLDIRKQREALVARKLPTPPELAALLEAKTTNVPWHADDAWHELALVTEGDELRLSIDGHLVASHRSPGYAHENKRWLSFLIPATVWIDDVAIWKIR